ncbi:chloride channel protein [Myroides sp. LJL115]
MKQKQSGLLQYILKWTSFSSIVGVTVGLACAFFLFYLDKATQLREYTPWLIFFLPLAGLLVGIIYQYWAKQANKGNNLLIEQYHNPTQMIPFRMSVMVLFGTLVSHLFGASVGREGTALQMGASLSSQLQRFFSFTITEKKTLILIGISAGFSGVFGTPFAASLFALEIMVVGKLQYKQLYPIILSSFIANWVVAALKIPHSHYLSFSEIDFNPKNILLISLCAIAFGLTGIAFVKLSELLSALFTRYITISYWRPFVGGALFVLIIVILQTDIYNGLGVKTIQEAFLSPMPLWVFAIKLLLTALVLSSGFKGGEVTPLFFIGATLGSALAYHLGLPLDAIASIGFVAVFCACTKTPLACIAMGIELFGWHNALYIALGCSIAFMVSGRHSIYKNQQFDLENATIK